MPIFEFVCKDCELNFEELIFGIKTDGRGLPILWRRTGAQENVHLFIEVRGDGASLSFGSSSAASCSHG